MAPSRTEFHKLTVARVDPLTEDSAAVTFDVPDALRDQFRFEPGQSLTIRRDGERRSYSICAARGRPPRIGVREVAGGTVSGWLVHQVRPGDVIEVQAPAGSFTFDAATAKMDAASFVEDWLVGRLGISAVIVGTDFRLPMLPYIERMRFIR